MVEYIVFYECQVTLIDSIFQVFIHNDFFWGRGRRWGELTVARSFDASFHLQEAGLGKTGLSHETNNLASLKPWSLTREKMGQLFLCCMGAVFPRMLSYYYHLCFRYLTPFYIHAAALRTQKAARTWSAGRPGAANHHIHHHILKGTGWGLKVRMENWRVGILPSGDPFQTSNIYEEGPSIVQRPALNLCLSLRTGLVPLYIYLHHCYSIEKGFLYPSESTMIQAKPSDEGHHHPSKRK